MFPLFLLSRLFSSTSSQQDINVTLVVGSEAKEETGTWRHDVQYRAEKTRLTMRRDQTEPPDASRIGMSIFGTTAAPRLPYYSALPWIIFILLRLRRRARRYRVSLLRPHMAHRYRVWFDEERMPTKVSYRRLHPSTRTTAFPAVGCGSALNTRWTLW